MVQSSIMQPHEYGPLIVIYDEPQDFFAPQDASSGARGPQAAARRKRKSFGSADQDHDACRSADHAGIYHKQRASFAPAILAEIDKRREELAAASPAGHLQSLHVPVLLLHGSDDMIIPPTEMLWLQRDIPKKYLLDALISPAIGHVDFGSQSQVARTAGACTLDGIDDPRGADRTAMARARCTCPPGCGLRPWRQTVH